MINMKVRVETYEQGTGKIIKVEEITVPDMPEPINEEDLRKLVAYAKKMKWII
jgi:hypothetical protein